MCDCKSKGCQACGSSEGKCDCKTCECPTTKGSEGKMTCGSCGSSAEECKCESKTSGSEVKSIDADTLKSKKEASVEMKVINVLDAEHFNDCHIQGSINIPVEKLAETCANWNKDTEICVYCASSMCSASKQAYKLLCDLGFSNVCAYEAGMKDWKEKGFDCEGTCEMDYLK